MFKYIVKRLALAVVILLGVSMIIYFLIRLMPVDFIQSKIDAISRGGATVDENMVKDIEKSVIDLKDEFGDDTQITLSKIRKDML